MKTPRPTSHDMDLLLAYLPKLSAPAFKPIVEWHGGKPDAKGVIEMPWPEYSRVVDEFFSLAASECWRDYDYAPEEAGSMIADPEFIRRASIDQIKTMLTYCVRGERFCDG